MNLVPLRMEGDTQKRMFEALRRISEEHLNDGHIRVSSHAMPDHESFFSEACIRPNTDFEPATIPEDPVDKECFSVDDAYQSESALSYEPMNPSVEPPLQVYCNGAKVEEQLLGSAWVPTAVPSIVRPSESVSTSSSTRSYSPQSLVNATVFAAAATAAIIVEHPESVPKRPRSHPAETFEDEHVDENLTDVDNSYLAEDSTTEASLDDSEGGVPLKEDAAPTNRSPRSIISSLKPTVITGQAAKADSSHTKGTEPTTRDAKIQLRPVFKLNGHLGANHEEALMSGAVDGHAISADPARDLDSPSRAALSKKRRAAAMERFRRKKAVRCYGSRVRYQVRRRIATTRPRVNGRFAKRDDAEIHASAKSEKAE